MKKYTNKILLCILSILLILNFVTISCAVHHSYIDDEEEISQDYYDDYENEDYLLEEEQF